jgi:hypothetical protein
MIALPTSVAHWMYFDDLDRMGDEVSGVYWPAPGSEDTELGVLMELEVSHGETEVHAGVQA